MILVPVNHTAILHKAYEKKKVADYDNELPDRSLFFAGESKWQERLLLSGYAGQVSRYQHGQEYTEDPLPGNGFIHADRLRRKDPWRVTDTVISKYGRLDIPINNPGSSDTPGNDPQDRRSRNETDVQPVTTSATLKPSFN